MKTNQSNESTAVVEPWINSAAACRHLGISNITLRRWVKDGRLSPKRTPTGEFRFKASDLDRVLA